MHITLLEEDLFEKKIMYYLKEILEKKVIEMLISISLTIQVLQFYGFTHFFGASVNMMTGSISVVSSSVVVDSVSSSVLGVYTPKKKINNLN